MKTYIPLNGLSGVAIAVLPSIICIQLTFSDGLGGRNMPKACRYGMMKSQRLKHFFGRLLCEYLHFFGRLFYLGISWGKKCFVFVGGFLGDFITLWVVYFFA